MCEVPRGGINTARRSPRRSQQRLDHDQCGQGPGLCPDGTECPDGQTAEVKTRKIQAGRFPVYRPR